MAKKRRTKYVHEGEYVVVVDVEILEDETVWTPYLSSKDAYRLDDVRDALRRRDFASARRHGQVFRLERIDS